MENALLTEDLEDNGTETGQLSSEMEEIQAMVEAEAARSGPAPSGAATASPRDPATGVPAEEYGMAHAAGYISAKCRRIDPTLGTPSAFAHETPLAETMWTRLLSQGGLSIPSAEWMAQFRALDSAFCIHHNLEPDCLSRSPRVVESLVQSLMERYPDLPDVRVVRRFVRLRTFLRLNSVNRILKKDTTQGPGREGKKVKQFAR